MSHTYSLNSQGRIIALALSGLLSTSGQIWVACSVIRYLIRIMLFLVPFPQWKKEDCSAKLCPYSDRWLADQAPDDFTHIVIMP